MRDQSQIEDMRAAVRGDIERAKQRRVAPVPQAEPPSAREPERVPAEEPRKSGLFSVFRKR